MVVWMVTLLLLSDAGFFSDFSSLPPRPLFAMLFPLPFVVYFAFSKTGVKILQLAPPEWLVIIQSFRIPVEVLLWVAFLNKQLPVNMTFEGRNFDVVSGILALIAAYFLVRRVFNRSVILAIYNCVGLLLLLNILIIAILSMPTSFRYFMEEPSNIIVGSIPYILLPGVLVPIAYSFHIFSLRQLFILRKEKPVRGRDLNSFLRIAEKPVAAEKSKFGAGQPAPGLSR